MKDLSQHPCFNIEAKHKYARVHLPVAPKCNIQCNYCNRKYDCCNESRPGVTSSLLSPMQAVYYMKALTEKIPNLAVAGIAGPGDPFANAEETLNTMRLAQKEFPDLIFCLSSNGLELEPYIDEIAEIGVSHVTITINSLHPETLAKIYSWVKYNRRVYRGVEAGKLILEKQLRCIEKLKAKGIVVKINTVVCVGVNDHEIEDLARKVAELGADTMNCISMYPTAGTVFEDLEEPSKELMREIKTIVSKYLKPMAHCSRCRADAAGLLGKDDLSAMSMIGQFSALVINPDETRKRIAVASHDGLVVDMHLGQAEKFYIFEQSKNGYRLVGIRPVDLDAEGTSRWEKMATDTMGDCQAVLVSGVGETPMRVLQENGVRVFQMNGLIDSGLEAVYKNLPMKTLLRNAYTKCGGSCSGSGSACG